MLAHFGGVAEDIAWPRNFDTFVSLRVAGIQYTLTRLVILGIAVGIGVLLYVWLKWTRTGMAIRAGVDDRAMVSALGINIQLTPGRTPQSTSTGSKEEEGTRMRAFKPPRKVLLLATLVLGAAALVAASATARSSATPIRIGVLVRVPAHE
jgi:hypothetical protein